MQEIRMVHQANEEMTTRMAPRGGCHPLLLATFALILVARHGAVVRGQVVNEEADGLVTAGEGLNFDELSPNETEDLFASLADQQEFEEEFEEGNVDNAEIEKLVGDIWLPTIEQLEDSCGVSINANRSICNRLIAKSSNLTCECYNFCGGNLASCYNRGEKPDALDCPSDDDTLVTGCHVNYTEPDYQEPRPCPAGYICSRFRKTSCDYLKDMSRTFLLGDIHAGIYCPGNPDRTKGTGYQNCPAGYYCPNSTTKIPCPEQFFCPHKTEFPEIECATCEEGQETLYRERWGYFAILALLLAIIAFMIFVVFRRRNQKLLNRLGDMQEMSMMSMRNAMNYRNRKKKLQDLKPKLRVIEQRANKMGSMRDNVIATETATGDVKFDARKLFDILDEDGNGELSYGELNEALQLKPAALREFAAKMNKAGHEPPGTQTISRAVFIKFFLVALEASSYFEPTPEEAAQLYDSIAAQSDTINGEVPVAQFYSSILTEFMTDLQINDLLRRFQTIQRAEEDREEEEGGAETAGNGANYQHLNRGGRSRSVLSRSVRMKRNQSVFSPAASTISREMFVTWYPSLLLEVTDESVLKSVRHEKVGVDLAFENLSLTVQVKGEGIKVVNDVTGRLGAGTMTALMGGSGAGKTSLLNALCGRAFYGDVTGSIKINGHDSTIEEHATSVGFVPQDDIVFAELTVLENLIFSGKFQLPAGTPLEEIEELAYKTMAGLGLSRVMHSMVGDVHRRGVSGGEKKRVNIGLELMSRPKILFLDEPTSGLDASSAMLVMQSLKTLVDVEGVTVCSVIHQPRKFIFDLFDSLILLGVGGYIVYHGKVSKAEKYFANLDYALPPGESVADWLIDISSGSLAPEVFDDEENDDKESAKKEKKKRRERQQSLKRQESESDEESGDEKNGHVVASRISKLEKDDPEMLVSAAQQEKARREYLYECWKKHFKSLSGKKLGIYQAPKPFDLPIAFQRPGFLRQLGYQLHRLLMLASRNWYIKLIDSMIIILGVIAVALMEGVMEPTKDDSLEGLDYYALAEPSGNATIAMIRMFEQFPYLFRYAIRGNNGIIQFASKCGVVVAVLVGLTATKIITEKRVEFYREAASGYNINAHFTAINVWATFEHGIQVFVCSLCSLWLRNSLASWHSYVVNFLMLAWLCVSWALIFPLLVNEKNVTLAMGFFMTFFGLLASGAVPPVEYKNIYENAGLAVVSGLLSPTRFFQEAMAVAESRCLPAQSGFTELGQALLDVEPAGQVASFRLVAQGLNDYGSVIIRAFNGWYWGVLPSTVIGFTIRWMAAGLNHVCGRPQQAKKPLLVTLAKDPRAQIALSLYLTTLIGLIALSIWTIFWTPTYRVEPTPR